MIFQSFRRQVTFKAASSIKWSGYENRRGCVVRVLWTLLLLRRIFSRNRVNTHAKRRFPANCFVFSLFFVPSCFSPRVVLAHRIGPSDCSTVLWRFRNKNATSRFSSDVAYRFSSLAGNRRKAIFTGKKSDSSRNDSLECNKRLKTADEKLFASYENFLLAFFEGSFVASRLPLVPRPDSVYQLSTGRIFCFESVVPRAGAFTFLLSRNEFQRHCRKLGDLGT